MKIGIFSECVVYNPPFPSGVARFFREITTELARRGHEIILFEPRSNPNLPRIEQLKDGITIYRVFSIPLGKYLNFPVSLPFKEIFTGIPFQFDVVHANSAGMGVFAGITSYRQRIPRIISYHTPLIHYTDYAPLPFFFVRSKRLVNYLERLVYNSFNLIIVPTEGVKDDLARRGFRGPFGFFPTCLNLQDLPHPSRQELRTFRERFNLLNKKIILFVGRMSPEKGVTQILELIPSIIRVDPDVHFLMVGTGPFFEEYKRMSRELNLTEWVTFTGYLNDHDLFTAISIAYIGLIFVNEAQIFDMTILEYWNYGLPLIIRKAMGIEEIVQDNYNGLLFSNLEEAKAKILSLLKSDNLHRQIRTNCKYIVTRHYDIQKTIIQLEGLYEKVLNCKFSNKKEIINTHFRALE
ncbi:MAG: glycosyltransferase [Candidatus Helarchaeota archaeon]